MWQKSTNNNTAIIVTSLVRFIRWGCSKLKTKRKNLFIILFFDSSCSFFSAKSKRFRLSPNLCNYHFIHLPLTYYGVIFPTSLAQPCQHSQQLHLRPMLERHFSIDIYLDALCANRLKVSMLILPPYLRRVHPHFIPPRIRLPSNNWPTHRRLQNGLLADPYILKWLRTALCTLTLYQLQIWITNLCFIHVKFS